jgi:hypothetical protein
MPFNIEVIENKRTRKMEEITVENGRIFLRRGSQNIIGKGINNIEENRNNRKLLSPP